MRAGVGVRPRCTSISPLSCTVCRLGRGAASPLAPFGPASWQAHSMSQFLADPRTIAVVARQRVLGQMARGEERGR
eukprot:958003-Lingulodinium_polyedra.AAC.1